MKGALFLLAALLMVGASTCTLHTAGSANSHFGSKYPDGFPNDFPRYPNGRYEGGEFGDHQYTARWETDDTPERVATFYVASFSYGAWTATRPAPDPSGGYHLSFYRRSDLGSQISGDIEITPGRQRGQATAIVATISF